MSWELVLTKSVFAELCRRLTENPSRVCVCPAGLARLADRQTALVSTLEFGTGVRRREANFVGIGAVAEQGLLTRLRDVMRKPPADVPAVFLSLGVGQAAGACTGRVLGRSGPEALDAVRVVAEGLPVARLTAAQEGSGQDSNAGEIWSRSIGALSEPVWRRLVDLRPAVFGCGRTGSLLCGALVRNGVRAVSAVDGDRLELGNCGEMDWAGPADSGRNKADVIAEALRALPFPAAEVHEVNGMATSLSALLAAKSADVLFSCVDNDSARLAVAMLAQIFLKPMVDIGTGVLEPAPNGRRIGADVRLILPGRCPACFGGLRLAEAAVGMRDAGGIKTDWRRQRAGSLRSLNTLAVGMALRLLEDFLAGVVRDSTWLSLNYENGVPHVVSGSPTFRGNCPICALAGLGDAGLSAIPELLKELGEGAPGGRLRQEIQ